MWRETRGGAMGAWAAESATAMQLRPRALATYIMVSAERMMSGRVLPSWGKVARPKLAAMVRERPSAVRK